MTPKRPAEILDRAIKARTNDEAVSIIDQALREAERDMQKRCAEVARRREEFGERQANETDDVEKTHYWWGYRDAGETTAAAIEALDVEGQEKTPPKRGQGEG